MKDKYINLLFSMLQDEEKTFKKQEFDIGKKEIDEMLDAIRKVIFADYFSCRSKRQFMERTEGMLQQLQRIFKDIDRTLDFEYLSQEFLKNLPDIRIICLSDLKAAFQGDPAARDEAEIMMCYPGVYAVFVHRIAHLLYKMQIPYLPRVVSEYAHSITGIDIHPGATVGKGFFIDHGTGVVIGETTEIGNNVKLYQGVTLGALSTAGGQKMKGSKRHPTIMDNVTIYAGASILGGNTIIGENTVIGANAFITASVPPNSKVSMNRTKRDIFEIKNKEHSYEACRRTDKRNRRMH